MATLNKQWSSHRAFKTDSPCLNSSVSWYPFLCKDNFQDIICEEKNDFLLEIENHQVFSQGS